MIRRPVFEDAMLRLSGQGFKILPDLLASSPRSLKVRELPYEFRQRRFGESKLDTLIAWEYAMLIADNLIGRIVPCASLSSPSSAALESAYISLRSGRRCGSPDSLSHRPKPRRLSRR